MGLFTWRAALAVYYFLLAILVTSLVLFFLPMTQSLLSSALKMALPEQYAWSVQIIEGLLLAITALLAAYSRHESVKKKKDYLRTVFPHIEFVLRKKEANRESPAMFRKPHYHWKDFQEGIVPVEKQTIERLQKRVGKTGFVFLLADSGAGKTTLAHTLAFRLVSECEILQDSCYYIDLSRDIFTTAECILEGLKNIRTILKWTFPSRGQRALVIIDNVHLSENLVIHLYRNRSAFDDVVTVLGIARIRLGCPRAEYYSWCTKLEGSPEATPGFTLLTLGDSYVRRLVGKVVDVYFSKYRPEQKPANGEFFNTTIILHIMSQNNLIMLGYILDSLKNHSGIIDSTLVGQINVNDSVREYYNRLLGQIRTHNQSVFDRFATQLHTVNVFQSMLRVISIYSVHELPTPIGFINTMLGHATGQPETELVNAIAEQLYNFGELVGMRPHTDLLVSFPHSFIAELIPELYPVNVGAHWLHIPNDIAQYVRSGFDREFVPYVEYMRTGPGHAVSLAAKLINDHLAEFNNSSVAQDRYPCYLLHNNNFFHDLICHSPDLVCIITKYHLDELGERSIETLSKIIMASPEPLTLMLHMRDDVLGIESIGKAFTARQKTVISNLDGIPSVGGFLIVYMKLVEGIKPIEATALEQSLSGRVNQIAESINKPFPRGSTHVLRLLLQIPFLWKQNRIQECIANAIRQNPLSHDVDVDHDVTLYNLVNLLGACSENLQASQIDSIRNAIDARIAEIAYYLTSTMKPWTVLDLVATVPIILNDDRIVAAAKARVGYIAKALHEHKGRPYQNHIIECIGKIPFIMNANVIQAAIKVATK